MRLIKLQLKNFRCFNQLDLDFISSDQAVLIEGVNGSGKTSLLEALHFLCYLRSFRTHLIKDLSNNNKNEFFIKATFKNNEETEENEIQTGFSKKQKLVKVNNKIVQSYKELMDYYKVITLTEDDLAIIKDGPDLRRNFIDQFILVNEPIKLQHYKKYKQVLENRNKLLQGNNFDHDSYFIWTKQLWEQSVLIQKARIESLKNLENKVNELIKTYFDNQINLKISYDPKLNITDNFDSIDLEKLKNDEIYYKRSIFGSHLDDFSVFFQNKKSRAYGSRGQQKLIILLLKVAQIMILSEKSLNNELQAKLFLLDDFMTDFDEKVLEKAIFLLYSLNCQLIFTCPTYSGFLKEHLLKKNVFILKLNQ